MNDNLSTGRELDARSLKQYFARIGLACLLIRVVSMALQYALVFAFYGTAFYSHWSFNWFLSLVPLYLVAVPLFWRALPRQYAPIGEKRPFGKLRFLGVCTVCLSAMILLNYLGFYLTQLINVLSNGQLGNTDGLSTIVSTSPVWVTVVFACIVAPIMEELVFRKLLVDRVLPFGELQACILSGLIFGLFHGNIRQFFYAATLGFIFAYVYAKTRNILYTIGLHVGINLLGSVAMPYLLSNENLAIIERLAENPATATAYELFVLFAVFATLVGGAILVVTGAVVAIVRVRKMRFDKPEFTVRGGVARLIYTDPAMIAAIGVMLATFVLALM